MNETASGDLFLSHTIDVECDTQITHYGTIDDANKYFDSRLRSDAWTEASLSDKRKALIMATRAIDRLNFTGEKSDATQLHQFPRGENTKVPTDIKLATYEEAYKLLDECDPEMEKANLSATSQGISSVRTTYDRTFVPENVMNGIISSTAWSYLMPYLRDPNEIIVSRV